MIPYASQVVSAALFFQEILAQDKYYDELYAGQRLLKVHPLVYRSRIYNGICQSQ